MKSPSQIIHEICGTPRMDSCADTPSGERCWLCAAPMSRGEPVDTWSGSNFTGQNRVRLPTARYVCEGCVFVCSRVSPVPGREAKEGKKFGGNYRNYSHLYERGASPEYRNASKGEKPVILEFLRARHDGEWFAAIADSGQKHVIPWTPINAPGQGGAVLFDEQIVLVPASLDLVDEMVALLTAGATKEEMGTGDYSARAWQLCDEALRRFEERHGRDRGGAWFTLALWLAQRDEEQVQRRIAAEKETKANAKRATKGKAPKPKRRGPVSDPKRVSPDTASECAEELGPTPDANEERVEDVRGAGGVGDTDRAQAPDRNTERGQLTLFEGSRG